MNYPTPHINATPDDFGQTVLMPGDPLRAKFIAQTYFEHPVLVNNIRGVQGYTGTWNGTRVSVMASGMGMPSMAIYSYELFRFFDVENIIRIGSSPMTPAQLLMELWSRVQTLHPDIKFQIVPFENTPENAREILANLGKNIDVVGGIFDETMLNLRGCAGLELVRGPFHCAVSIHHRLAAKDKLQITDLYGENLMLMHRGWSHYVDQLRDDLWQHHPQIHIVDFDFYNMDVFNRCENTNDVLLAIPGWATVHPLLKIIPVEWNYSIPYGILHSPEPTPTVQRFLDAAKIISKELYS